MKYTLYLYEHLLQIYFNIMPIVAIKIKSFRRFLVKQQLLTEVYVSLYIVYFK